MTAHIVALSGGKDSTAMALRLSETDKNTNYEYCITPTGRELPPMEAHWAKLECLLGKPIVRIPGPLLTPLIINTNALPNHQMRWCTRLVKIEPFLRYAESKAPAICYVGVRADEADAREGTDHTGAKGTRQDCPLVRWGWEINDVRDYLQARGVEVPERTDCDLCFYQRIGEWWRLWRDYKDRWSEIESLEERVGHTLRSDQRDTWPASLKGLRQRFEAGYIPKGAAQQNLRLDVSERPTMCAWCAR